MLRYLHLCIYVDISIFHKMNFTSVFDHYIEQNICFYSFWSSQWKIYKIAVLISAERIKTCLWKCPVLIKVADYRSATPIKLSLFTVFFSKILITQTASYSVEQLCWRKPLFAEHFLQWLFLFIHQIPINNTYFFLLSNFSMQLLNLAK